MSAAEAMCDPLGPFIERLASVINGEWAECLRDMSPADRLSEIEELMNDCFSAAEGVGECDDLRTAQGLAPILVDLRAAGL